ncbi:hypothetical protein CS542_05210 [Pedobacter sp. IW39]|nr:hypothetical protein CS542_05210 [Pedobacter sp. IW39]
MALGGALPIMELKKFMGILKQLLLCIVWNDACVSHLFLGAFDHLLILAVLPMESTMVMLYCWLYCRYFNHLWFKYL